MKELSVNVWVFPEATIPIPADIIISAKEANSNKSIFDKRTKGYKIIKAWSEKVTFPFSWRV